MNKITIDNSTLYDMNVTNPITGETFCEYSSIKGSYLKKEMTEWEKEAEVSEPLCYEISEAAQEEKRNVKKFSLSLNPRANYSFAVCNTGTGELLENLTRIDAATIEREINYWEEKPYDVFYSIRENTTPIVEERPYVGIPVDVFTEIVDILSHNGNEKALRLLVGHALIKGGGEA